MAGRSGGRTGNCAPRVELLTGKLMAGHKTEPVNGVKGQAQKER